MDHNQFENDIPSDALDAMADMAYHQEQAMRESNQSEWSLVESTQGPSTSIKFYPGLGYAPYVNQQEDIVYDNKDAS